MFRLSGTQIRSALKNRRLTAIEQLGMDRIIHLEFGLVSEPSNQPEQPTTECSNTKDSDEESETDQPEIDRSAFIFHLFIELYALGNIVLTDHEFRIKAVLRPVKISEAIETSIGHVYDWTRPQVLPGMMAPAKFAKLVEERRNVTGKEPLRQRINEIFPLFSPAMVVHCIVIAGLEPSDNPAKLEQADTRRLYHSILELLDRTNGISPVNLCKGYLMGNADRPSEYVEFHPMPFEQFQRDEKSAITTIGSFNEAVDLFFSKIEEHKLSDQLQKREQAALSKLEAIRREQQGRIQSLIIAQDSAGLKARLLEENIRLVEDVLKVFGDAVRQRGMDWRDLEALLIEEKRKDNPVALIVDKLKLEQNKLVLLLGDPSSKVDVDIRLSAHANINEYYETRREAAAKQLRTEKAHSQALSSASLKIRSDMATTQTNVRIIKARKHYWFEKFAWFISSENYLVIGGKDAQQNELIVKRYLRAPGDLYVHADMHGAGSIVIKNPTGTAVPPKTLSEAACMSLCQSKAWTAKIVTSAWWVHAEQVSKTAPSGEYLSTGSFMIRGAKNFLPASQLVYGIGFLFKLDETGVERHRGERNPKPLIADSIDGGDIAALTKSEERYRQMMDTEEGKEVEEIIDSAADLSIEPKHPKQQPKKKVVILDQPPPMKTEVPPGKLPRGKGSKLKKIKKKYANQDEEEREIKMRLLGSIAKSRPDPAKDSARLPALQAARKPSKQKVVDLETVDTTEILEESETQLHFDDLTGAPFDDDQLQVAIPMCAPYAALQAFRYKVKLVPGTLKKGKAARMAVNILTLSVASGADEGRRSWTLTPGHAEKTGEPTSQPVSASPPAGIASPNSMPRIHAELIKRVPEQEIVNVLLGEVQIQSANVEALKKKAKAAKKAKAKSRGEMNAGSGKGKSKSRK